MKGLWIGLVLALIVLPIAFTASPANARIKDRPNSGYCKSGAHVANVKFCREFGGGR